MRRKRKTKMPRKMVTRIKVLSLVAKETNNQILTSKTYRVM